QPVKGVAVNELVSSGIEFVGSEIAFAPFEILFGKIDAGRPRACVGGANGEAAGIGEGVQDLGGGSGLLKQREIGRHMVDQKSPAVVPLVEKQTDRIAFAETQFKLDAVFANEELFRSRFAEDMPWRRFGSEFCGK